MSNFFGSAAWRSFDLPRAYFVYSSGFKRRLPKFGVIAPLLILLALGHLEARRRSELTGLERPQLVWQGKLEGTHDLIIQNNRVRVEDISGPPVGEVEYRFVTPLPATEVKVDVDPRVSRGWVHTVQEPTLDNSYTLRVRIEDRQSGPYFYSIAINWQTLYKEPAGISMTKSLRSHKNAAVPDSAWFVNDSRAKVTCGAIWSGVVRGTARIAIGDREARIVQGKGSGDLDPVRGTRWPKGAYLPVVMATSMGTRAEIVDHPTPENDYTLVIEVRAGQPAVKIEIAW
ncbi:MAG: hypothetical protein WA324_15870 [Bryobacteraceae bacterium]